MQVILYFASILLTCALTGFLAFYAWRQRSVPGSRAYAYLALGECLLALAEIFSMLSPTPAQALFWFKVRYLSLAVIPVFWLVFALEYSGRKDWLSKRLLAGMFVIPAITQVLLWSNNLHGLWVKQEVGFHQSGAFWIAETSARLPGPGLLANSLYGMILLLAGIVLLLIVAWRMRHQYRGQALLVAGTGFTAFVIAFIVTFNLLPRTEFNPFTPGIGLSVLLIALAVFRFQFLKRAPAAETDSRTRALEAQAQRSLAVFLFIFLMMVTGIAAVGYLSYQNYESQFRAQVESQLASIAKLKVDELEGWRKERLADAETFYRNPSFSALVQRYLENPSDTQAQAELQVWLDHYHANEQYDRIFLLDARGVERLSAPATPEPVASHLTQEAAAILSAGQVTFLDFHRDTADGAIHLALLVPIFAEQDSSRLLGILVLRIDPHVYLYPYIQQWPVPSASAETLLIRREGADALFLNELDFQAGTALNLRVPQENTEFPAVKVALGQVGIVEGVDYRGVPVIADVRAVPDSPWFLVARVDTAEVFAPLRERLWETVVFFGALMAAAGAGLVLVWRQQRVRYYRGQVEAVQALQASEELYRSLFENMLNGFAYCRMLFENGKPQDFIYLVVNDAFETLTGLKNVAGRKVTEVIPGIRESDPQLFEIYGRVTMTGQPERFEMFVEALQMWFWISVYSPVHEHFVAVFDVITERKRAEEALRWRSEELATVLDALPVFAWISLDPECRVMTGNRAANELIGAAPGTNVSQTTAAVGNAVYFRQLKKDGSEYQSEELPLQRAIALGQPVRDVEIEFCFSDGRQAHMLGSAAPLFTTQGQMRGAVAAFMDITERRRQEAQILAAQAELQRLLAAADQSRRALLSVVEDQKRAEETIRAFNAELEQRVRDRTAQLEAANQELEAFAYSVSHDLRAPLRALDGFSAALLSHHAGQLDEQSQHYLDRIQRASQRMGQLINDLLNLSRVTRAEFTRQPVDLGALAHGIAAELQGRDPQRQAAFLIAEQLEVQGDPRLLRIALQNLLENAWKFTGLHPQAHIEVGVLPSPLSGQERGEGPAVGGEVPVYFVRDNGVGFDMAYAGKLFAPFQRLHGVQEFPGTGIGLATVQRIITRHGGRIWPEAAVDGGATFYFTLGGQR